MQIPERRLTLRVLFLAAAVSLVLGGVAVAGSAWNKVSEPSKDEQGFTSVTVLLPVSEAKVRSVVSDIERYAMLSSDVKGVQILKRDECTEAEITTRGITSPMAYVSRSCPTKYGWRSTLVSSEAFDKYESSTTIKPVDGGVRVTMRTRIELKMKLPQAFIDRNVGKSMQHTMERLAEECTAD